MFWAGACLAGAYYLHDKSENGDNKYYAVFWLVVGVGFICREIGIWWAKRDTYDGKD